MLRVVSQAYSILATHGICVIQDFFNELTGEVSNSDISPLFTCEEKQAKYILRPKTSRVEVFNNVVLCSKSSTCKTELLTMAASKGIVLPDSPRMQLELEESDENKKTMAKYKHQMDILLHNIFPNREYAKKSPLNWIKSMTNIVGGTEHQHAHADQGRPQSFRDQTTFPFVATHGFGRYTFDLWILPNGTNDIKYGYLQTFSATSLVLLRGDFVHAGGVSQDPRCHMSFYPLPEAGLVHDHANHYWLEDVDTAPEARRFGTSFLWQGPHFPFAYPFATQKPNSVGQMRTVLSYPPEVTAFLLATEKTVAGDAVHKQVAAQRF
jgi:hypothetical protein